MRVPVFPVEQEVSRVKNADIIVLHGFFVLFIEHFHSLLIMTVLERRSL